jgi:hypothetical protein
VNRLIVGIVPPLATAAIFEIFLRPRHDYTGHYLAGYGATLAMFMLWLKVLGPRRVETWGLRSNLPLCLLCILLGAGTEATIFRLARFDEIDFCSQSLGAVLAAVAALSYSVALPQKSHDLDYGLITGIAFLGVGGCFAFA